MHEPKNTSAPGTRNTHRVEDSVPLKGGNKSRLPLESSGLFREDRTIELSWQGPGGLLVFVTETGERAQDVVWSFQLGSQQSHRFPVAAGLRIDVLPETDGLLNFRTLNAGAKRGPPTDTGLVVLPPLGVWTDVGWCPGFRTDVCIFRADLGVSVGVPVIEAAFFTFAGTLAGFCPAEEIVIHPPMFKLRARNNSAAAPTSIIAVWR